MRGRKPLSIRVKLNHGKPGGSASTGEPQHLAPTYPAELSQTAKDEWHRVVAELVQRGRRQQSRSRSPRHLLPELCLWVDAIQAIQKYGPLVESPNGYPQVSPYLAIANKQAKIMIRIASEFGFTPASRTRIATEPAPLPLFEAIEQTD